MPLYRSFSNPVMNPERMKQSITEKNWHIKVRDIKKKFNLTEYYYLPRNHGRSYSRWMDGASVKNLFKVMPEFYSIFVFEFLIYRIH